MNTSIATLEERISTLEDRLNDTPERRAAEKSANEEAVYLSRLDRSLARIRKDLKGLAAHLRMRIKHEVEQAQYQLDILRRENRTHQHLMATDALARIPHDLATAILSPRFPEAPVFWMNHSTTDAVEAAKARKAYLEQHRADFIQQAVSELLEAARTT